VDDSVGDASGRRIAPVAHIDTAAP
jgi:hypothetical protein